MFTRKLWQRNEARAKDDEAIRAFAREIERQKSILYGVALFFEGISFVTADDITVIETYRKQFRNIIRIGHEAVDRAEDLLRKAIEHPGKAELLRQFKFTPCLGHPNPGELEKRDLLMVRAYDELFPHRPREQPFTGEETVKLMRLASSLTEDL